MNPAGAKEDNKKDEDKRDPILAPLPNNHSLEDIHEYAGKPGRKRPSPFCYSDREILRKKRAQGKGRTRKKKKNSKSRTMPPPQMESRTKPMLLYEVVSC
jgi:hypothetical protein